MAHSLRIPKPNNTPRPTTRRRFNISNDPERGVILRGLLGHSGKTTFLGISPEGNEVKLIIGTTPHVMSLGDLETLKRAIENYQKEVQHEVD